MKEPLLSVTEAARFFGISRYTLDGWVSKRQISFVKVGRRTLFGPAYLAIRNYLDLSESAYGLLAAWAVGTYFAHLFTAFPFLHFYGPKESCKSKNLEAQGCVCFNAWNGRDITAAALGDTADGQRGTLLLDQAEKVSND